MSVWERKEIELTDEQYTLEWVTMVEPGPFFTLPSPILCNEGGFRGLLSDAVFSQQAIDAVNNFTRTRINEDGFYRRIMPPILIGNDELDRPVDTDKPVKVVDKIDDRLTDVRQILQDAAIAELVAEEDAKFIAALKGATGENLPVEVGQLTRSMVAAMKLFPKMPKVE
jgi:hypothetical protein